MTSAPNVKSDLGNSPERKDSMSPAEKVQAMRLLETGAAELAVPAVGTAGAMKASMVGAAEIAVELKRVIEENGLSKVLKAGAKPYVFSDGWLTAARIQNESTFSKILDSARDPETGALVVHAEGWLEDISGRIVSRADGYVSTEERTWSDKPFYALASMAQTRAIAKAMRIRHAWIMVMAGYSPTPAEEMEGIDLEPEPAPAKPAKPVRKPAQVIPPQDRIVTRPTPPEKSIARPEPAAPPGERLELFVLGFNDRDPKRWGFKVVYPDGSEGWVNCWDTKDQQALKDRVLKVKAQAMENGVDPSEAGVAFTVTLKRTAKKDGSGDWLDISDVAEVANGN